MINKKRALKKLSITLDSELLSQIRAYAEKEDIGISNILRKGARIIIRGDKNGK